MTRKTGVLLCGHGSRDNAAIEEFSAVAATVRERLHQYEVEWSFLEFARPIIDEGLDRLRERGCRDILAVPAMLFAAGHVKNDMPSVLNRYQARHPHLDIRFGRDLGIDPKMMCAAAASIKTALAQAGNDVARHDTLLMVVGRGTSDPDANSNVSKVMRLLWEGFGFGWGEAAYSGVTFPLVEPALEHAARLGYKRIVVFPYFLFTGVLVRRIYEHTDKVAVRHRSIEFVKASYLNDHPLVLDTICDRVEEILLGAGNMNCQLCKYRTRIFGFEDEVALPQESHHHHVEGISHADGIRNDYGNGDGHGHHHPYPHADHPLGPVTLKRLEERD